jgi:hypothetical protein
MAETVNAYQDVDSQILKIGQLVKQSRRKRSKLIVVEKAATLNFKSKHELTVFED